MELAKQIEEEEKQKSQIQDDIKVLTKRLSSINESLGKKVRVRDQNPALGPTMCSLFRSKRNVNLKESSLRRKRPMPRSWKALKHSSQYLNAKLVLYETVVLN